MTTRAKSCDNKVRFYSRKAARRARGQMNSKLNVYLCDHCDYFHLGHMPQRVRNGEVDTRAWRSA